MSWLAQIAPGIATALGGLLAGLAVTAVAKALNSIFYVNPHYCPRNA